MGKHQEDFQGSARLSGTREPRHKTAACREPGFVISTAAKFALIFQTPSFSSPRPTCLVHGEKLEPPGSPKHLNHPAAPRASPARAQDLLTHPEISAWEGTPTLMRGGKHHPLSHRGASHPLTTQLSTLQTHHNHSVVGKRHSGGFPSPQHHPRAPLGSPCPSSSLCPLGTVTPGTCPPFNTHSLLSLLQRTPLPSGGSTDLPPCHKEPVPIAGSDPPAPTCHTPGEF